MSIDHQSTMEPIFKKQKLQKSLELLPDELIREILEFCGYDVVRETNFLVCSQWNRVFNHLTKETGVMTYVIDVYRKPFYYNSNKMCNFKLDNYDNAKNLFINGKVFNSFEKCGLYEAGEWDLSMDILAKKKFLHVEQLELNNSSIMFTSFPKLKKLSLSNYSKVYTDKNHVDGHHHMDTLKMDNASYWLHNNGIDRIIMNTRTLKILIITYYTELRGQIKFNFDSSSSFVIFCKMMALVSMVSTKKNIEKIQLDIIYDILTPKDTWEIFKEKNDTFANTDETHKLYNELMANIDKINSSKKIEYTNRKFIINRQLENNFTIEKLKEENDLISSSLNKF